MPPKRGARKPKGGEYKVAGEYEMGGNFMEDVSDFADNYVKPAINVGKTVFDAAQTAAPYVAKFAPLLMGLGKRVQELNQRIDELEGRGVSGGAKRRPRRQADVDGFMNQEAEPADDVFMRAVPTIPKKLDYEKIENDIDMDAIARNNRERTVRTRVETTRRKTGGQYETGGYVGGAGSSPYRDLVNALKF